MPGLRLANDCMPTCMSIELSGIEYNQLNHKISGNLCERRRMNWRKVAQLSLVHVGVTITVVPITSTLNRIMIADLHLSALLVGLLVACPYLLSPLQVVIGNWADRNPIWGRHRSPWMVLGGLMAAFGSYFTAHAVFLFRTNFALGLLVSLATFTVWGVGVNIASVSYLSLISELSKEEAAWRNRAVSVMWTAMIIFIILTAFTLSRMLEPYSQAALYTAFGMVWLVASFFILLGSAGIEPAAAGRIVKNKAENPLLAFRLLAENPAALRFFVYLLLVLVSIHAQDVLLEPFGAEVLAMPVAMTSRLTSIWGVGLLLTLTAGILPIRRYGKKRCANLGGALAALAFMLIVMAGLVRNEHFFMGAVFLLGLGGGLMTISNLSFMLDMTVPQAAGLYIGAWGVADFLGRAIGTIFSGLLRDVLYQLTGQPVVGYSTVFGLETLGLLIAIWLFRFVSVEEFRQHADLRIHDVLAVVGD
jgi:BCD family chlorophyll transporter-like MFS transporter